jgi:hypothetical protein
MILMVEDSPDGDAPWPMQIDGYTDAQIAYHAYYISGEGLAESYDIRSTEDAGPRHRLIRLTIAGHDFAKSARMPVVWNEVVAHLKRRGVPGIRVLKALLDRSLRKHLDANDD